MSDDKIRRWEDKERAAYFAHQKFYDFDGREISRDEAMRLACSENGFIHTNAPHLVAVDRSVIEEACESLADLDYELSKYYAYGDPLAGPEENVRNRVAKARRVRDALKASLGK